jgi:hypothetical protein
MFVVGATLISLVGAQTLQPQAEKTELMQVHVELATHSLDSPDRVGLDTKIDELMSSNGCVTTAKCQGDGNFVIYDCCGTPLWHSNTWTTGDASNYYCIFQGDANLVVYDGSTPKWASGTDNSGGTTLIMQNDNNLVIYDANMQPKWASNTCNAGCAHECPEFCAQCTSSECLACEDGYEEQDGACVQTVTEFSECAGTVNDAFCDWVNLGTIGEDQYVPYDNSEASVEADEPAGENSVWFRFRVSDAVTLKVSQRAGSHPVELALFEGPGANYMCDDETAVFSEFDATIAEAAETLEVEIKKGENYYLQVTGEKGCGELFMEYIIN